MPTIKDKMPNSVHVRDLRGKIGQILDRVIGGENIVVTRFGRPIVVLVSYERWQRLERLSHENEERGEYKAGEPPKEE